MSAGVEKMAITGAWRRFVVGRDGTATPFENRMRGLRSRVESLNLAPDAVHLAAEIAALESSLDDEPRFALIVLIVISLAALGEGSTRYPVTGESSREPMGRMLEALCGADQAEALARQIEQMLASDAAAIVIGKGEDEYKPLLYCDPFIYHQRIHLAERLLAGRLTELIASAPSASGDLDRILDRVSAFTDLSGRQVELSAEQRGAVACAARNSLTLISGGPGTGKTSIVLAIIRMLTRMGVALNDIALAAPTGKAAYRIRESIQSGLEALAARDDLDEQVRTGCPEPSTIHRLLGYSPRLGTFRYHSANPLSARAVIVDEGSMLDLALMHRLLDAVQPGARLVILGDADQLPSVAAGAVFRDLGRSRALSGRSIELTNSYRMAAGGSISGFAAAIKAGAAEIPASAARRLAPGEIAFSGVEMLASSGRISSAFLERWYEQRVAGDDQIRESIARSYMLVAGRFGEEDRAALERLFAFRSASRLLCVTRVMENGADRINAWLHRRAARDAGLSERRRFIAGEAVMVLRNDYERMLFNGDTGIVLKVRRADSGTAEMAVFPSRGGYSAFRLDSLEDDLDHCYAMTVHKAQGSEFDSVAVILPERDVPLLTREIVYTGVSRARRSALIAGNEELLRLGISRKIERYSGLGDRLGEITRSGA